MADPFVQHLITMLARRSGIDPAAALAVAGVEGGVHWGGVGDSGTSFGPFQLHVGGALPSGRGSAWANTREGLAYAIRQMAAEGARGLHGRAAIEAIVRNFERPSDPGGEIQNALRGYGPLPAEPAVAPLAAAHATRTGQNTSGLVQLAGQLLGLPPIPTAPPASIPPQAVRPPLSRPLPAAPTGAPASAGYPQMTQGAQIPQFHMLQVAPQADALHVDIRLLVALQQVARMIGRPLTIISGYRSPSYSAGVGGYSTDPHTRGVAADVQIDGVAVGVWLQQHGYDPVALFRRVGLESGAQPGFYRGSTDPEHVQIPGSGVNKSIRARRTIR